MNLERAAGAFLIVLPLAFNTFFFLLARSFDYPAILRSPSAEILARFQAGGVHLKLLWYGFMLTAVLLAPLAVILGQVLARDDLAVVPTATVIGVLAAVVQFLGLARWPFLVPALARTYEDPASSEVRREAAVVAFESFHRYLGVAVGECLGYLFTGAWTVLIGVAMLQSSTFEAWLAWPGIVIGLFLVAGSLEFVGRFEERGWTLAGVIVPIAYTAWSLWLIGAGLVLLFGLSANRSEVGVASPRMAHLWSRAVATSGNRWQMRALESRRKQAKARGSEVASTFVDCQLQPDTRPACWIHFCISGPCVSSSVLTLM